MSQRMLINVTRSGDTHPEEIRLALTERAKLIDLDVENPKKLQKVSNIYKGKISSIEPSLGAVFVDYGSERHGFLPLKEVSSEYFRVPRKTGNKEAAIGELLKVGQPIVIQVEKEERDAKGAALTTFISLAGAYMVLMPNNPRAGGISRRISGEEREQLKEIINQLELPEGMGFIIRTAGLGKSLEELEWDLKVQLNFWELIKQAAVERDDPYLIHQESNVIKRAVRDYLRKDIEEIIIDDTETFEVIKEYIAAIRPDCKDIVKLYDNALPLFSHFNIEQQIEAAYRRDVRLPSGGSMVIDHTEALISVDINSARATRGGNIEETAYQTNLEAAEEVARQLRIRDIGGLIVIDFIDMLSNQNQRDVENKLRESLANDRARIQIGRISRFGLMEMSRQRIRTPLKMAHQITCERCSGRGTVRTVESVSLALVRLIEEQAIKAGSAHIQVQAPVDIATYLLNEKRLMLRGVQDKTGRQVIIIPNSHLISPNYTIKLVKDDHTKQVPSYKQVKIPKADNLKKSQKLNYNAEEPAINQYLSSKSTARQPKKTAPGDSLIKRLWDSIFGSPDDSAEPAKKNTTSTTRNKPNKRGGRPGPKNKTATQARARGNQSQARTRSEKADTENQKNDTRGNRRGNRAGANQNRKTPNKNTKTNQPNKREAKKTTSAASPTDKPKNQSRSADKKSPQHSAKKTPSRPASKPKNTTEKPIGKSEQSSVQPVAATVNKKPEAEKPKNNPVVAQQPTQAAPTEKNIPTQAVSANQVKTKKTEDGQPKLSPQAKSKPAQTTTKQPAEKNSHIANNPSDNTPKKSPADYFNQSIDTENLKQVKTKAASTSESDKKDS